MAHWLRIHSSKVSSSDKLKNIFERKIPTNLIINATQKTSFVRSLPDFGLFIIVRFIKYASLVASAHKNKNTLHVWTEMLSACYSTILDEFVCHLNLLKWVATMWTLLLLLLFVLAVRAFCLFLFENCCLVWKASVHQNPGEIDKRQVCRDPTLHDWLQFYRPYCSRDNAFSPQSTFWSVHARVAHTKMRQTECNNKHDAINPLSKRVHD